MNEKPEQPKQLTPKGQEIPVPKRADFLRDLKKIADKPPPPPSDGSAKK